MDQVLTDLIHQSIQNKTSEEIGIYTLSCLHKIEGLTIAVEMIIGEEDESIT